MVTGLHLNYIRHHQFLTARLKAALQRSIANESMITWEPNVHIELRDGALSSQHSVLAYSYIRTFGNAELAIVLSALEAARSSSLVGDINKSLVADTMDQETTGDIGVFDVSQLDTVCPPRSPSPWIAGIVMLLLVCICVIVSVARLLYLRHRSSPQYMSLPTYDEGSSTSNEDDTDESSQATLFPQHRETAMFRLAPDR